ncbi:conserved hypothetical protein [Pseudomonas veronii]|jgi:uncharacterized protein YehS (DUF1456 family)|uniref:Uncharacterized protein n=1 Tax=Pseudomonas helleri TaxID=1608996 RepID=A0A7X1XKX2_9PSED|nr:MULTISPECIES: hypothetical protein [Pseudomonas]MQT92114.1 hypothetical protein [Pseudomonas helleri]NNA07644.1 hypothetical protein [Pseudomonas lundensis]RRV04138.1 hypothetical protein EGJ27_22925 [Pseudomonas sp. v388]CAD0261997.1 conserved hypothetical protein [Pseudomonas veronii]
MRNDETDSHPDDRSLAEVEAEAVVEYSEEFAAMILDQDTNGRFQEIDVDDMLALLDHMILEARGLGSVH